MKIIRYILGFTVFLLFLGGVSAYGYFLSMNEVVYRNISVSGVDIGGLSVDVAQIKLEEAFSKTDSKVSFVNETGEIISDLEVVSLTRDFKWAVEQAYGVGRSGNFFLDTKTKIKLLTERVDLTVPVTISDTETEEIAEAISATVDYEPVWPEIKMVDGKYALVKGSDGLVLNKEKLKQDTKSALSYPATAKVVVMVNKVPTIENVERVNKALEILNNWGNKELSIRHKEYTKILSQEDVVKLLGLTDTFINQAEFKKLVEEVSLKIETEPKDAIFEFEEGKVKQFSAEVVGVRLDIPKFEEVLTEALSEDSLSLEIPTINEQPKVKTGDINNLGIKELLGVGKSSFKNSIPGRVFNVNLAASRINGTLVPPGEEFSFNKAVGEINRQTGYQTAYVISEGRTVLGDGGGVCQVSTTAFRAAMNFGFPITERKAHSYRVGYYEQDSLPGLDATIYSPSTDFKFLNDTSGHILIQAKVDTKEKTMRIEIYGTTDGRVATVSKPVITSQSSAPATVYVDDPTLPKGTMKQIDWAASGAKVNFDYKVERNGEVLFERKFLSNYQPWRAVFLKGTGE